MSESYESTLEKKHYDYAKQYLGETEIRRDDCIKEIQEWLRTNPELKSSKQDPISILHFLRGCKFDIEKTKSKLVKFYTSREKIKEWYKNRDPQLVELQELLDLGVFLPLQTRDSKNRLVVIIRVAAHDPKKHSQDDVFKIGQMILDLVLHLDETVSIYGVVAIFDLSNVTLGHALQLPPSMIKKAVDSWQCYPTMVKRLDFVNAPSYVNVVLNVFRRFMGTKLRQRVMVHKSGISTVPDLPREFLDNQNTFVEELSRYWKEQLDLYRDWFVNDMTDLNVETNINDNE